MATTSPKVPNHDDLVIPLAVAYNPVVTRASPTASHFRASLIDCDGDVGAATATQRFLIRGVGAKGRPRAKAHDRQSPATVLPSKTVCGGSAIALPLLGRQKCRVRSPFPNQRCASRPLSPSPTASDRARDGEGGR